MRPRVRLGFPAPARLAGHLRAALAGKVDVVAPGDDPDGSFDAIVAWRLPEALLSAAGDGLRLCVSPGADVAQLLEALRTRPGVRVANCHGNAHHTAESAVALLLAAMKDIPRHDAAVRTGREAP